MGGRGLRLQCRHLGAAHGAGLAGADRAHPSQRLGGRHGDGAAVRAAALVPAVDRIGGRPPGPAQAPHGHAGHDGGARGGARAPHRRRARPALACLWVRLPVRRGGGFRRAGAPNLRRGTGGRRGPVERRRAELDLVQRRPDDRPRGLRFGHRRVRDRLGVPDQRRLVRRGADLALRPSRARASPNRAGAPRQGRFRRRAALRPIPSGPHRRCSRCCS